MLASGMWTLSHRIDYALEVSGTYHQLSGAECCSDGIDTCTPQKDLHSHHGIRSRHIDKGLAFLSLQHMRPIYPGLRHDNSVGWTTFAQPCG